MRKVPQKYAQGMHILAIQMWSQWPASVPATEAGLYVDAKCHLSLPGEAELDLVTGGDRPGPDAGHLHSPRVCQHQDRGTIFIYVAYPIDAV